MKSKIKYLKAAFFIMLVGIIAFLIPSQKAHAADFSYQEGRDGFELTDDNDLAVTFTVSNMESGLSDGLIKWGIYLFPEDSGLQYNASTHKYISENRQRNVATYYFLIDPSDAYDQNGNQVIANETGTFTVYVDKDAVAYNSTTANPSSSTDYGTNTGETFSDVINDQNWIIGVGPMFSNWWSSGYSAPIDYYVGRQSELIVSTIYFRDYDGTQITTKKYKSSTSNVDVSGVGSSYETDTFTGWYCDADKQTYQSLSVISSKRIDEFEATTNTINFYATYQRSNGKYIEFTPNVTFNATYDSDNDGIDDSIVIDPDNYNETVTVTYRITHNDGVNSLLFLPIFDSDVFEVSNVLVDETTSLGLATITNDGYEKILLESENTYSSLNDSFITITYNIISPVPGEYDFGLKRVPYINNNVAQAFYWLEGTSTGEQEELDVIALESNKVKIVTIEEAEIKIGYNDSQGGNNKWYSFTYKGSSFDVERINQDSFSNNAEEIEYYYTGSAENLNINWYTKENNEYTLLNSAPVLAGTYYIGISAPAHGLYKAVDTVYREVVIGLKPVTISIDDKESVYGDAINELTYSVTGLIGNDDLDQIILSTTVTSSSNVGEYAITATYNTAKAADKYNVTVVNGTYTITYKTITITVLDQSAPYTGSEPEIDQTKYTVTGVDSIDGVVITKDAGVNVGQYLLYATYTNPNYSVTYVNGTYTITSVNKDLEYFEAFFEGRTVTYNGELQDLLVVEENLPTWFTYSSNNNEQKNANEYLVSVVISLTEQNAANYTNGVQELQFTVPATINKYAITIYADSRESEYGSEIATLTPTKAGFNDEIDITYTVLDGVTPITLTPTTNVGEYTIVPNAVNANYEYTFVNGAYTVTKTTPVITVTAANIYYNRELSYTVTVTVAGVAINQYTLYVDNNLALDTLLNCGEHTLYVNVPEGNNYLSASESALFTVSNISLAVPVVSYNHDTATWEVVTKDANNKDLVSGTTLAYYINNELMNEFSYQAFSTEALTLTVVSTNNNNYAQCVVHLKDVYRVEFTTINGGFGQATGMPVSQYQFYGEYAVSPNVNPSMTGYTFDGWDYNFATSITANTQIPAIWNIIQFEIRVIYPLGAENEKTEIRSIDYGTVLYVAAIDLCEEATPVNHYDFAGLRYEFLGTWKATVTGTDTVIGEELGSLDTVTILGNYTFVALYDTSTIPFTLTYMLSVDGQAYEAYQEPVEIQFGDEINYKVLATKKWFKVDAWYTDENRAFNAPSTMPANDLTVYGSYVFNVGTGDINGDGSVDANDITLYRQWVVGGYNITVLENNEQLLIAAEAESNNPTATRYFILRVADNNGDEREDIRDISITRMAIVGGYTWDIEDGYNVTGEEIIRNVNNAVLNNIIDAINAGKKATLTADYEDENSVVNINTNKNVYIDLAGHTLTVRSFNITSNRRITITVKNGTIVSEEGITISAPQGNVVLENVEGYVGESKVNLAAANHSLHFNGAVKFYAAIDTTIANPTPAVVNVERNTHVVIEQQAELVVEKLVVTVNFETPTQQEEAAISIDNYSVEVTELVVDGEISRTNNSITTVTELVAAGLNGGNYTVDANINVASNVDVLVKQNLTLDLNGYTIRFAGWGFEAREGATLTINGNGNIIAQEAPLYAQYAGHLVINGGTYTAYDNFVIGTNGTSGRGLNTITINGGTFNGQIQAAGYLACGIYVANNDTVVVNGGTFNITNGVGILARSGNTTVGENVAFNVTGNGTLGKVGDSKVTVPSGEVLVIDYAANYPGGDPTLTNNNSANIYALVDNLTTLVAAIEFANTVALGADITYTGSLVVSRNLTLELNNHKLESTNAVALFAENGATLTINGNGQVVAQEAAAMAINGSKLEINGGTYTAKDNFVIGTNGTSGKGLNTITINGGTFNGQIQTAGYVACGIYVANNDTVVVNGGTFNITNGVGILARSGNTTVGENVVFNVTGNDTLGKVGDSKVTVPSGEVLVIDYAANYPGGDPTLTNNNSANIYALVDNLTTLVAAIEFANTVALGADITYTGSLVVSRNLTLELNNHKLESTNDVALFAINGATLTINGDGQVVAQEAAAMAMNASNLEINGGTYTAKDNFVIGTNGTSGKGLNTITINGGTFNGQIQTAGFVACGIYIANNDTVVVNGGTFNITNGVGILARSGNTTVGENVVFNVTGNGTLGKVGDSKVTVPSGEVLVIDYAANYPGGEPTLTNNNSANIYVINQ